MKATVDVLHKLKTNTHLHRVCPTKSRSPRARWSSVMASRPFESRGTPRDAECTATFESRGTRVTTTRHLATYLIQPFCHKITEFYFQFSQKPKKGPNFKKRGINLRLNPDMPWKSKESRKDQHKYICIEGECFGWTPSRSPCQLCSNLVRKPF